MNMMLAAWWITPASNFGRKQVRKILHDPSWWCYQTFMNANDINTTISTCCNMLVESFRWFMCASLFYDVWNSFNSFSDHFPFQPTYTFCIFAIYEFTWWWNCVMFALHSKVGVTGKHCTFPYMFSGHILPVESFENSEHLTKPN